MKLAKTKKRARPAEEEVKDGDDELHSKKKKIDTGYLDCLMNINNQINDAPMFVDREMYLTFLALADDSTPDEIVQKLKSNSLSFSKVMNSGLLFTKHFTPLYLKKIEEFKD